MTDTFRTTLRPGDIGRIVEMHGRLYQQEYGYDERFEAYVAQHLAEFAIKRSPRERIWIAESDGRIHGVIAIVEADDRTAQLRWYLVAPEARGAGLGRRLMNEAIGFARQTGYGRIMLWTVEGLDAAVRIYRPAGFRRIATKPGNRFGVDLVEEQYAMELRDGGG